MAIRSLTFALAATMLTAAATAQAAAPMSIPERSGSAVEGSDRLSGGSEWLPVLIFVLAVLSIMLFEDDGDDAISP